MNENQEKIKKQYEQYWQDFYTVMRQAIIDAAEYLFEISEKGSGKEVRDQGGHPASSSVKEIHPPSEMPPPPIADRSPEKEDKENLAIE